MKETPQQRSDVEKLEGETQPHSLLTDYVNVEKPMDEDFRANFLSKAIFEMGEHSLIIFQPHLPV